MLQANAISKSFGAAAALIDVALTAHAGEIHALIGENGAGKSTLVSILTGRQRSDHGTVTLEGAELRTGSPQAALAAGIAAVYQTSMLFERMTWEDNLALGGFGRGLGRAAVATQAAALADSLGFALPPPATTIERQSVAERVRLEILRALSFKPRVLILDEPTGVLAPHELSAFISMLRRLRAEGRIVIIVTHKLGEALAVADRVTVLRHGRVAGERIASATTAAELARLMIGEWTTHPPAATNASPQAPEAPGPPALELDRLTLDRDGRRLLDGVCLRLAAGTINGVAGVDGNGQAALLGCIAGLFKADSGHLRINRPDNADGADNADRPSHDDRLPAVAVIPQDRDREGLILAMPLWENLALTHGIRRRYVRRGWLRRTPLAAACTDLLERFRIRTPLGSHCRASALSGGNRQRLAVARALAANPRILVAHDICRGLDLRASAEVHQMLRDFAAAGGTVLLISTDLDELLALCLRLWVLCRGRATEVAANERDPERLGLLMAGAFIPSRAPSPERASEDSTACGHSPA
jgi:simple sugar transport system ATP-binding protein